MRTGSAAMTWILALFAFSIVSVFDSSAAVPPVPSSLSPTVSPSQPPLLLANRRSICLVDLSQTPANKTSVISGLEDASAVDFIYQDQSVFWTDVSLESIKRSWMNGTQTVITIIATGLIAPDGLACDWVGRKIYWTDSETNRIEVTTVEGRLRRVLLNDLDQPRAIALDPLRGYMYWTDWGETPRIERAGMDGSLSSRQRLIVTDIFWPNGLTLDYEAERIYWADGKLNYIHSCAMDGSGRMEVLRNSVHQPFALTLFEDTLYWTDWQSRTINACNKYNGSDYRPVVSGLYSPMDLHAYHPSRQRQSGDGLNPCGVNNGNCSDLCLMSPEPQHRRTCACPTGVVLLEDNKTCADGPSQILLLARRSDLRWISLDTAEFNDVIIDVKNIRHAIAIDYDPVEGFMYWTDDEAMTIRRSRLNGSEHEIIKDKGLQSPDGIAVDWIARNLYWTDSSTDRIEVSRLNGSSHKVLVADDLSEPRAIVLHPLAGHMYWTDWGQRPKIERASLDGSDRVVLVNQSLGWPNGIAIDHVAAKLYWADAKIDRIEWCNLDGTERRILLQDKLPHVFGMTLLGDYVYWTDWQDRAIQRVHKTTGRSRRFIVEHLPDLMGVKAVNLRNQHGENGCSYNNGGCSHLCLNRPQGLVCACPMGFELLADGRRCIIPEAFLLYSRHSDIRRISLETNNNDALIPIERGVNAARALGFDVQENRIYWTDVEMKTISSAFINGSSPQQVVFYGLETPEGVAVDWVARNLYWADSGTRRIEMSRLSGASRRVIVSKNVQPTAIVVDPANGFLYWSNSMKSDPRLERANLDGSSRTTILSDVGRISDLTIDFAGQRLFWANAERGSIESATTSGMDRRMVISGLAPTTHIALTLYQEYIYWTNSATRTIERVSKIDGGNRTIVQQHLDQILDICVFHSSRQAGWNECAVHNGRCSDLCISHPTVPLSTTNPPELQNPAEHEPTTAVSSNGQWGDAEGVTVTSPLIGCSCPIMSSPIDNDDNHLCVCRHHCACPTHYELLQDNITCQPPESFLLVSLRTSVLRLSLDLDLDLPDVQLPISNQRMVRAVEFDPISEFVYWIDTRSRAIRRAREDGSESSVVVAPLSNPDIAITSPFDIAIDAYARMLYWSDSAQNVISMTRLNGTSVGVIVRAGHPRSIALAPDDGFLFWTSVSGSEQKIERTAMDGTSYITLFNNIQGSLGSLAVDRVQRRVYWANNDLKRIERGDFDGANRHVVVESSCGEPAGMFVHGAYLYYINRDSRSLERIDKLNGLGMRTILSRSGAGGNSTPSDVMVAMRINHAVAERTPCGKDNGGCSHICIVRAIETHPDGGETGAKSLQDHLLDANNHRCSCPFELSLAMDQRTCVIPPTCKPTEFACVSDGVCIPEKWHCDSHDDCKDKSDESNCTTQSKCNGNQFECTNGDCISLDHRCNRQKQCSDGSDEKDCKCDYSKERECGVECVPLLYWCDRKQDCASGEDEEDCSYPDAPAGSTTTYAIGMSIIGGVVAVIIFIVFVVCVCQRKTRQLATIDGKHDDIVMVVSQPTSRTDQVSLDEAAGRLTDPVTEDIITMEDYSFIKSTASYNDATLHGSESPLYDRDHITGASSSASSTGRRSCGDVVYPKETLNPPPSPITDRYEPPPLRGPVRLTGPPAAAPKKRLYKRKHRRKHQQQRKHPTTPCSTEVCEDSEAFDFDSATPTVCARNGTGGAMSVQYFDPVSSRRILRPIHDDDCSYESDLLCPPPPTTPHSHYLSEELSCPPSPSTERSFFITYPPPPPSSVLSGGTSS